MDAKRYFDEMHKTAAAKGSCYNLLLTVKYEDIGGKDAYIELRRNPSNGITRIYYSTMGRNCLNAQLLRKGWQLCHNNAGELVGHFPSSADELIDDSDFYAICREDFFDADKADIIIDKLKNCAGTYVDSAQHSLRDAAVTFDSFVGNGAHWRYYGTPSCDCMTPAAILYWLADYLAGSERRALQSNSYASEIAAQWLLETNLKKTNCFELTSKAQQSRPKQPVRTKPIQNERWRSIYAVLCTV